MRDVVFSVIIPAYNRVDLLRRCLESLEQQTYTAFEVLVVDDCSNEDIRTVVEGIKLPSLFYYRLD